MEIEQRGHREKVLLAAFAMAAFAAITFYYFLPQSQAFAEIPRVLSLAAVIDLTIVFPAAYLLLARKTRLPVLTAVPLFYLTLVIAGLLLPADQQHYLSLEKAWLAPLVELAAISYLGAKASRVVRAHRENRATGGVDFICAVRESIEKTLGRSRVTDVLASEIAMYYYGFIAWRISPEVPAGCRSFTYHLRNSFGAYTAAFAFLIPVETVMVHILVSRWNTVIAWILTILSVYTIVFLLANYNAARKRPIYVAGDELVVRVGLVWRTDIPLGNIAAVIKVSEAPDKRKGLLRATPTGECNLLVELSTELEAQGMYGIRRRFERMTLALDEPEEFMTSIQQLRTR